MPIRRTYDVPATLSGELAVDVGRGNLLRELQQINMQEDIRRAALQEQARQADMGVAARLYEGQQDRQFGYDQLGSRNAQFQQGLQQDAYLREMQIAGGLEQQALQNQGYAEYQAQATQRALLGAESQMARQREKQRFDKSLADREAILQWMKEGRFVNDNQKNQAIAQWEQQAGMPWGAPDQMSQEQAAFQEQQDLANVEAMFADPFNPGQSLIAPGTVQTMLNAGMTMDKVVAHALRTQTEARNRQKLQFDTTQGFQEEQRADVEAQENMRRDDERAQQKMVQQQEQFKQKMLQDAMKAYQTAYTKWVTSKNDPMVKGDESTSVQMPEPKLEDFLPPEFGATAEGRIDKRPVVTNGKGERAYVNPDGTVELIK